MKKILGLDLGTTSIGWALVNEAESKEERSSIVKLGVRLVPLNTETKEAACYEKGKNIETNAKRTQKRSIRRNIQRYKLRRRGLIECLKEHHIITDGAILSEDGPRSTFHTLRKRAQAATEEISLEDLARVLVMINKKRGYKSNRKAAGGDEGALIDGMEIAQKLSEEGITPAEYVLQLFAEGKKYVPEFYASDLSNELDRIWKYQSQRFPAILTDELRHLLRSKGKNDASKLFYARCNVSTAKNTAKDKRLQSYQWRAAALDSPLTIDEVAYAVCDLCGQISSSSTYLGNISNRSKELYFQKLTVGQYLMAQLDANPNTSLKKQVFYRQDYLDEFNAIWDTQANYHPELTDELKKKVCESFIFFQRPLRSQNHLVAYCEFESQKKEIEVDGKAKVKPIGLKVCPKSSPLFQEFKIWHDLNNLNFTIEGKTEYLTLDQKKILADYLMTTSKCSPSVALKLLSGKKRGIEMNVKELHGNETMESILRACRTIVTMSGHEGADDMTLKDIKEVFDAIGFNTDFLCFDASIPGKEFCKQPAYRFWHLLYSFEGDNKSATGNGKLIEHIMELTSMPHEYAQVLAAVTFKEDYGSLSAKAIRRILPFLKQGMVYSEACEAAGYRHSAHSLTKEEIEQRELKDRLEVLPRNSLRNPVVEKILNQMIHVVNAVCAAYGKPDEIRLEMAREMKKNKKQREQDSKAISDQNARNEEIRRILETEMHMPHVSRNHILRYRLYMELEGNGFKTLYTNTYIPRDALFSRDFDIEHIIPQARLFDDSFSNKTLETRSANQQKDKTTAFDFVSTLGDTQLEQYKNRIEALYKSGAISKTKYRNLLIKGTDIPQDFLNRDLNNTQYIAREAIAILEQIVRTVTPTTGSITERLRKDWQLVDLMKELNFDKYRHLGLTYSFKDRDGKDITAIKDWTKRNDHRHHAMDALTIAFTRPAFIQYLNNISAGSDQSSSIYGIRQTYLYRDTSGNLRFYPPIPLDDFRAEAKEKLGEILISIKAKNKVVTENVNRYSVKGEIRKQKTLTPRGALHEETVYGQIQQYETSIIAVNAKMTVELAETIANQKIRLAVLSRLHSNNDDPKKAFTGKNAPSKNPIWLDEMHTECVPEKVKVVNLETVYTIRKPIDKDIKIDKVIDPNIRRILTARLQEFEEKADKAFSNLDENPIWLNEEKGIAIKRVTIAVKSSTAEIIHQNDYVLPGSNHHIAFYADAEGKMQAVPVSFFKAVALAASGLPVVDKSYKASEGWTFLFTMKLNEYFVFPNAETDFMPTEVDLLDPANADRISPNLFRVQALSEGDYIFRHHLDTTTDRPLALKDHTFKRCQTMASLQGIVKVRINHLGQVVEIGE